ncbi:hypothetical protein [Caballeronia sp. 15715]|uniref:hypothetical protein n=1 Tax=unclassified Caballeronia TaxID=2646786 RepID=UPI0039E30802
MTESMIGFVVGLAVMIGIAAVMGRRYRREHPEDDSGRIRMHEWLDSHHMSWMHHKH